MTPSNNDLESFWRTLKETMLTDQRVGHRKLLEYTFPQMLFLLYPDYTGPPFRRSDGVERKSLLSAATILQGSKTPVFQRAYGLWFVNQSACQAVSPRLAAYCRLLTADC